ncbi:MAG: DNA translocase FtsK 4TM domain-containing protein, partial [Firmicutes bacterium]|nr:DNA translocase FtsK 4TM domain-containing protein [Bacillota bacterium]
MASKGKTKANKDSVNKTSEKTKKTSKKTSSDKKTSDKKTSDKKTSDKKTSSELSGRSASSDKPKFEFKPNIEVISILVIFMSIIILLGVIFSSGGIFGQAIGTFMKGLFGLGAYILPVAAIIFCVSLFFSDEKIVNVPKLSLSLLLFLLFIGFVHILGSDHLTFETASDYVKTMYSNGNILNGGLVGACIGDMFHYILGSFGSFLLFFSAMVCCVILLTGKSLSDTILNIKNAISSHLSYELSSGDDEPGSIYDDDFIEEDVLPEETLSESTLSESTLSESTLSKDTLSEDTLSEDISPDNVLPENVSSKNHSSGRSSSSQQRGKKTSVWTSILNFFTQEVETEVEIEEDDSLTLSTNTEENTKSNKTDTDKESSYKESSYKENSYKEDPSKARETAKSSSSDGSVNTNNDLDDTFVQSGTKGIIIKKSDGKRYKELKPPVVINIHSDYKKKTEKDLKIAVDEITSAILIRRRQKALKKIANASIPEFLAENEYASFSDNTVFKEFKADNTVYFPEPPIYYEP